MVNYNENTGVSFEEAIIITGAKNAFEGIDAEYSCIIKKYGKENVDWKLINQFFYDKGEKKFDVLEIQLKSGEKKEVYFEISSFFGRTPV